MIVSTPFGNYMSVVIVGFSLFFGINSIFFPICRWKNPDQRFPREIKKDVWKFVCPFLLYWLCDYWECTNWYVILYFFNAIFNLLLNLLSKMICCAWCPCFVNVVWGVSCFPFFGDRSSLPVFNGLIFGLILIGCLVNHHGLENS